MFGLGNSRDIHLRGPRSRPTGAVIRLESGQDQGSGEILPLIWRGHASNHHIEPISLLSLPGQPAMKSLMQLRRIVNYTKTRLDSRQYVADHGSLLNLTRVTANLDPGQWYGRAALHSLV